MTTPGARAHYPHVFVAVYDTETVPRPPARIDDEPGKHGRGPTKRFLEQTEKELTARLKEEKDPAKKDTLLKSATRLLSAMLVAMAPARHASPRLRKPGARGQPEDDSDEVGLGAPPEIDTSDLAFSDYQPSQPKGGKRK